MIHEDDLKQYRAASIRTLLITLLATAIIVFIIGRNYFKLADIEAELLAEQDSLAAYQVQKDALEGRLRELTTDPDGGIKTYVRKLPTSTVLYDFSIWVDVTQVPANVSQVVYEFENASYPPVTSAIKSNGFASYLRGPVCPGVTNITLSAEDGSLLAQKQLDFCKDSDL